MYSRWVESNLDEQHGALHLPLRVTSIVFGTVSPQVVGNLAPLLGGLVRVVLGVVDDGLARFDCDESLADVVDVLDDLGQGSERDCAMAGSQVWLPVPAGRRWA